MFSAMEEVSYDIFRIFEAEFVLISDKTKGHLALPYINHIWYCSNLCVLINAKEFPNNPKRPKTFVWLLPPTLKLI